jgi:hypothetical protein
MRQSVCSPSNEAAPPPWGVCASPDPGSCLPGEQPAPEGAQAGLCICARLPQYAAVTPGQRNAALEVGVAVHLRPRAQAAPMLWCLQPLSAWAPPMLLCLQPLSLQPLPPMNFCVSETRAAPGRMLLPPGMGRAAGGGGGGCLAGLWLPAVSHSGGATPIRERRQASHQQQASRAASPAHAHLEGGQLGQAGGSAVPRGDVA